jgi:hypothetical protein
VSSLTASLQGKNAAAPHAYACARQHTKTPAQAATFIAATLRSDALT